jgi:hypothetical protein
MKPSKVFGLKSQGVAIADAHAQKPTLGFSLKT